MANTLLHILFIGIKPFLKKQREFHNTIVDFRARLANLENQNLTEADIDKFYEKLESFDFSSGLFDKYYRAYRENLNRFRPKSLHGNIDLTFLIIAIAENKWKPTEPSLVFKHYLKYDFLLTSKFFIKRQKKQNLRQLNPTETVIDKKSSFSSSKKWTKVPLTKGNCKPGCGCSPS